MYHCHIHFYLTGRQQDLLDLARKLPPLEHFTHAFSDSQSPDQELTSQADVILADLRGADAERTLQALSIHKKPEAQLILLAGREQTGLLLDSEAVTDIWTVPMSEAEFKFRFLRWQRVYQQSKNLWESEEFLETCINSSPTLIWYKNKYGIHEKVNDSFCQMVNKTKPQVEGQTHSSIWNVEHDDPDCVKSDLKVMSRRQTCVFNESVHASEGEKQLVTYKSPLYDLDGSVMGTVGVAVDVTRERVYEQEIVEKDWALKMLFSTMDCGVMCHSIDGKQLHSINQAALQLLGYETADELMADGFDLVAQSVVDEDKPKLRESIQSLKQIGDSINVEYRVRHKDGKLLHVLGNVKLVEESGKLFYQRFLLDYTAHKRQEEERWAQKDEELHYQEQLFEIFSTFLADNVDDIYLMLNENGQKTDFVSTNVERVLGIPWQAIMDDPNNIGPAKYLSGKEVGPEALAAMEPGMSLDPVETERIHQKTGEHKWFRERTYCVSVQNKKKIIIYISDRTKERKTQDALTEALEIAQVANKAKSTFLSSVSHDIRTPMNAIMGFIPLLQEEANNPDQVREYTQKISAASQHLLGLINDVLDMNKIESGSAVLNITELNLAEVIDEINTIIRPQARAKEQTFEIYTTSLTREHLLGDKLRINQILINILSNAVKYTHKGGRIEMRVKELPQVDKHYSRIQFVISDNGQGMSREYQRVIFDPFTREQDTAWNEIQGTGLGMAITKSLVDLMSGSISVSSELGSGSTFTVELELRIQETEFDPKFWERYNITRMIVTDDDEDICLDIVKKMAETGVVTQYATRGTQAVEMIRSARERGEPYDLILLDWHMPDLNGLETARLIRRNYSKRIPILLFTAYDWNEIEKDALEVGIKHFLPKPFFMCNFKDTIQRMLGSRKAVSSISGNKSVVTDKHIMVVDDIEVNRMILVKILTTLGAKCDTAVDGQDAVNHFEQSQPGDYDLILMDIQMPILNGYEATRAIRASGHPSAQSIAIIAMTANAFVDDIRDALEAGMDAHIPKPIVLDQLKRTIQEVMDRKSQGK